MDHPREDQLRRIVRLATEHGLWIPDERRRLPPTVAPVVVVIDHAQLGLQIPSTQELLDLIRAIPLDEGLAWTSRLAITVANTHQPPNQDQHLHLAAGFFSENDFDRISRLVAEHPDRIIFHRLQLLSLFRLILNVARPPGTDQILPQDEVRRKLGQAALAINAYMERGVQERLDQARSDQERRWRMLAFGVRNMAFHRGVTSFDTLIGRSWLLWKELPTDRDFVPDHPMAIDDLLRAATGLSVDDYLLYGILVALAYQDFSLVNDGPESPVFTVVSRERPVAESEEGYMHLPRRVIDILTSHREGLDATQILHSLYDFLGFRQRPMVGWDEDARVPVDLIFLQEIVTIGVFWLIDDSLGNAGGDAASQMWRQFFGNLLEFYIRKLAASAIDAGGQAVRRVFGQRDWLVRPRRRGENPHLPDVAVVYPGAIIFIEVIATRLHFLKTAIQGDPDRLQRDLEQMVYEPAAQLHGSISDFHEGRIALEGVDPTGVRAFPLIVVPDVLPQFPSLWEEILAELARRRVFSDADRSRFEVWDLDEFEQVMSLLEDGAVRGADLAHFIDAKVSDNRSRSMPLGNYLVARDFQAAVPAYVWEARRRVLHHLSEILQARRRPA